MQSHFCRQCRPHTNVQCFETLLLVTPNSNISTLQHLGERICKFFDTKKYAEWKNQGQTEELIETEFGREWVKCTLSESSSWIFDDTRETIGVRFSSTSDKGRETKGIYNVHFKSNAETRLLQKPRKEANNSNDNTNVKIQPNNESPDEAAEPYKIRWDDDRV